MQPNFFERQASKMGYRGLTIENFQKEIQRAAKVEGPLYVVRNEDGTFRLSSMGEENAQKVSFGQLRALHQAYQKVLGQRKMSEIVYPPKKQVERSYSKLRNRAVLSPIKNLFSYVIGRSALQKEQSIQYEIEIVLSHLRDPNLKRVSNELTRLDELLDRQIKVLRKLPLVDRVELSKHLFSIQEVIGNRKNLSEEQKNILRAAIFRGKKILLQSNVQQNLDYLWDLVNSGARDEKIEKSLAQLEREVEKFRKQVKEDNYQTEGLDLILRINLDIVQEIKEELEQGNLKETLKKWCI